MTRGPGHVPQHAHRHVAAEDGARAHVVRGGGEDGGGVAAEHRVEDGDAVGADDADPAELLQDADEHDDEEGFVHLGVAPQVPHVVALALLVLSGTTVTHESGVVNKQNQEKCRGECILCGLQLRCGLTPSNERVSAMSNDCD